MNKILGFQVGEIYTNDQIRFSLDVENLGGIRPALDSTGAARHVAILTAAEHSSKLMFENPYKDRIEGDILVYTAQGREGNQELSGRNKRLVEQYSVPLPLFGFMNLGKRTYRFLGLLEVIRHYQESQTDKKGQLRKVWLFELRIHSSPSFVPVEGAMRMCAELLEDSRRKNEWSNLERELVGDPQREISISDSSLGELETIRSKLMQIGAYDFESFFKTIMEKDGFINVSVTKASGDGGIDLNGYVDQTNDYFAGTHVQVQVKRWRHSVGSVELNKFRGALDSTAKGVFVTTSQFTKAAVVEAKHESKPSIMLIDGVRLSGIVHRLALPIVL